MKTQELFEEPIVSIKSTMGVQPDPFPIAFFCYGKKLNSLEGSPKTVDQEFFCANNKLKSLEYGPTNVIGDFNCHDNLLESLEFGPVKVGGNYSCAFNKLMSLKGAPKFIGGIFACSHNPITSLEGIPSHITGQLACRSTELKSLKGIHKFIKHIGGNANFTDNEITSHVLGLLRIEGLTTVLLDNDAVENIINKHLAGDRDIFACQEELIEAGFEEFAKL